VEILAKEKGISDSDALNELCDRAGVSYWRLRMVPISAEESKRIADASTPIIRAHPGALIKQYAIRTVNLVVGPEKYILQVLGIPPVTFGVLGKAKGAKASGTGLGLAVLAVEVLLILVVYAGVLKTLIQALKGQVFPAWVWVGFWFAVYTLGLSAAVCVGDPRYRWPVYPLLIMVAAASFARPRAMPVAEAGRDAEKTPATTAR